MSAPVRLAVLTPDDWGVWRSLRLRALAEAPYAFGSTLAEWTGPGDREDRWRGRLADVGLNLVAYAGQEPVGMASGLAERPGEVEVISMWVAPEGRGRGISRLLLDEVRAWAAHACPGAEVVLAVRRDNHQARSAYAAAGFVEAGGSGEDPSELMMRWAGA